MKQNLPILLLFLLLAGRSERLFAQAGQDPDDRPTRLFRIYEDNDFLNAYGRGTDNAYTNGTRLDLFYTKKRPSRFIIDRLMPKAGDSSVNVFGWGIMQVMFTPNNLAAANYQENDYPYSGALFSTHTLYSYNPVKKYDIQTELVLGVMGPAALAKQTQDLIHGLIQNQKPMGWGNQLGTGALVNIDMTVEKQLASWGSSQSSHSSRSSQLSGLSGSSRSFRSSQTSESLYPAADAPIVEVIGGAQVFAGTMMNGLGLYPLIRVGLMNAYFQGLLGQLSGNSSHRGDRGSRMQVYLVFKPEAEIILTNALLQGAIFTDGHTSTYKSGGGTAGASATTSPGVDNGSSTAAGGQSGTGGNAAGGHGAFGSGTLKVHSGPGLSTMVYSTNYGAVIAAGRFSISFMQSANTAMMKGLYNHEVGNISTCYSW
jgi:lipid A 3-O-deacylase